MYPLSYTDKCIDFCRDGSCHNHLTCPAGGYIAVLIYMNELGCDLASWSPCGSPRESVWTSFNCGMSAERSLHQRLLLSYEISYEKAHWNFPDFLSLCFVGPQKNLNSPPNSPPNFPSKNHINHQRASAGAQGEQASTKSHTFNFVHWPVPWNFRWQGRWFKLDVAVLLEKYWWATRLPFATKTLPTRKKYFRIIFRLPFHDFDFFELILENYPIPIAFVWVVWHYPVGTPVLVELFFITVTRFEFFRINWVMFSWQMVGATGPRVSERKSFSERVSENLWEVHW